MGALTQEIEPGSAEHLQQSGFWLPMPDTMLPPDYIPDAVDGTIPTVEYDLSRVVNGVKIEIFSEIPDDIKHDHRIIIGHGLGATAAAYEGLRRELAQKGYAVTTYSTPRRQSIKDSINLNQFLHPEKHLCHAFMTANQAAIENEKKQGIDDLATESDAVVHSMGGKTAAQAALAHPDQFRSIVFNQPACFGKQHIPTIAPRGYLFTRKELPGTAPEVLLGAFGYIGNNVFRTLAETVAVVHADIRPIVRRLGALGIRTGLIFGKRDNLIPPGRTIAAARENVVDLIAAYSDADADHMHPIHNPKETAQANDTMLAALHGQEHSGLGLDFINQVA